MPIELSKNKHINLIFIDYTCAETHISIKNKAIGASEYQFYNLIEVLSKTNNIKVSCYNHYHESTNLDNIIYNNIKDLANAAIPIANTKIIIQRFYPYDILKKFSDYDQFLWIHDTPGYHTFLGDYLFDDNKYMNKFMNALNFFANNPKIYFIMNSENTKKLYNYYLLQHSIKIDDNRIKVIYNILYENEFKNANNNNLIINKNNIVFASSWTKNINKIIEIFSYIYNKDKTYKLILMSPGYEDKEYVENVMKSLAHLKNNVVIYGPVPKDKYAEIIKSSLCVLAPRFIETFGSIFAESYYLKTPVICDIESGAVKEIIGKVNVVNYDNKIQVFSKINYIKKYRDRLNIKLDDKFLLKHNLKLWLDLISI